MRERVVSFFFVDGQLTTKTSSWEFFIVVVAILLYCSNAFQTDPWYDGIYFFGAPYWNLSFPLTLIGDYLRIENLALNQNNEFMFVSKATLRDGKTSAFG